MVTSSVLKSYQNNKKEEEEIEEEKKNNCISSSTVLDHCASLKFLSLLNIKY